MSEQEIIEPVKNALAVVEIKEPAQVFVPNGLDPLISGIRERALKRLGELDISTPKNRKAIISLSVEVRDAKVFVESKRVALVEAEKKRLKLIDAEGSRVWDELEALQKEVRKPVTDWEQAEEARVDAHNIAMKWVSDLKDFLPPDASLEEVHRRMELLKPYKERKWEEFYAPAQKAITTTEEFLTEAHARRTKEIADAAELQRLRDEQAARDKKEREDKIAADAAAEATRQAEAKAALELKAEQDKAAKEKADADAQIKAQQEALDKAARDKAAAEQKVIDDAAAAAKLLKEQQEQAEKDTAKALADQRQAAIDAKKRADDAQAQRDRDEAHTKKINNEILDNLMLLPVNADHVTILKNIIIAIKEGKIPHVKITY